jgi:hypothetical protein
MRRFAPISMPVAVQTAGVRPGALVKKSRERFSTARQGHGASG